MPTLKKQLLSGTLYIAVAKYAGVLVSLGVSAVLARLLTPADFGIVAIAMVFIVFFSLFSDMGIAPAIIQHKDLTEREIRHIFSFTGWVACALSVCFWLMAKPVSLYYQKEILVPVCRWLSVNLFFVTLNIVPNALFLKNKQFRFIATRTLVIQLACGLLAILAAWWQWGIYALLIVPVLSSLLVFIVNMWVLRLGYSFGFELASIRKIFSYSAYQFLFNLTWYVSRNCDKLFLGKYLGMAALGYYEKSYRLMMLPVQNLTFVVTPVIQPVFSDFRQEKEVLVASCTKLVRLFAWIGFPLSVFLFFAAKELVLLVFGMQWLPAVAVFRILSLSVGFQIVYTLQGPFFQSFNAVKILFWCGSLTSGFTVLAVLAGVFYFQTVRATACLISLSYAMALLQTYYCMYRYVFKISFGVFLRQLFPPVLLSLLLGAVLYGLSFCWESSGLVGPLLAKAVLSFLVVGTYLHMTGEWNVIQFLKKTER